MRTPKIYNVQCIFGFAEDVHFSIRLQGARLLVGQIILVSGDIFFIFMIMNKKETANSAQTRAKVKFAQYLLSSDKSETF